MIEQGKPVIVVAVNAALTSDRMSQHIRSEKPYLTVVEALTLPRMNDFLGEAVPQFVVASDLRFFSEVKSKYPATACIAALTTHEIDNLDGNARAFIMGQGITVIDRSDRNFYSDLLIALDNLAAGMPVQQAWERRAELA